MTAPVTDDDRNDPVDFAVEPEPGLHVTLTGPMYAAIEVVLEQAQADYEQAARDAAAAIEARNVAQVAVSYLRAKLASLGEADAA